MATIGKHNTLRVTRESPHGFYLDGGELGEILLPGSSSVSDLAVGENVTVFVYRDSEDRLIATTESPKASVGELALLKVHSINPAIGSFLDWGLQKDLLLPYSEQDVPVAAGDNIVALVLLDEKTDRIYATTKLGQHLNKEAHEYAPGHPVAVQIVRQTNLGYIAVIEGKHLGLLYANRATSPLDPGQEVQAYIDRVRPDGKIDLTMESSGRDRVSYLANQILDALKASGGRLELSDNSPPELIREKFGASKKAFKQAVGNLYRQRRIRFKGDFIESFTPQPRSETPPPAVKKAKRPH